MSGLCLGATVNLAMAVLTFFQPTSPSRPIVQIKKDTEQRKGLCVGKPFHPKLVQPYCIATMHWNVHVHRCSTVLGANTSQHAGVIVAVVLLKAS